MAFPTFLLLSEGGFNPLSLDGAGGTFWTLLIFAAALLPIWKMVMGPVTRALEERDEKAAAGLAAAERAGREAENARVAVENQLREARAEAAKLVDAARARAEDVERKLKDDAAREAAALLARAKAEIATEQEKALGAIRNQVVDLSLHAAGQVLQRRVDAADDRRLVEELVAGSAKGRPA